VYFVQDGLSAVDFLSQDRTIQLIFLDWNMPVIEGGETIRKAEEKIAGNGDFQKCWLERNLPVVTYTGEDAKNMNLPQVEHFVFVDHWPKSMGFEELMNQVRAILSYVLKTTH
jgi:CheY-like chemotaxis protein